MIHVGWGALVFVAFAVAMGVTYERRERRRAGREFPPPGKLVDIGGRRLHLDVRGSGSPTVVLEAGMDIGGSLSWSAVHDEIAKTTRTCAYSRAGIMWSDPRGGPWNIRAVAEDLHAALLEAGEQPPFILVGHSAGGPCILAYTKYFGSEVAGLVFVDASHPDQERRFRALTPPPRSSARTLFHKAMARLAWAGCLRAALALSARGYGQPTCVRAHAPTSLIASFKEMGAWNDTLAEAGTIRDLGDRPVQVLTSMAPVPEEALAHSGITAEQDRQMKEAWKEMHAELASWSSCSQHRLVPEAGHYIQFDRPDVVIEAVRSVIDQVRANERQATPSSGPFPPTPPGGRTIRAFPEMPKA